MEVSEKLIAQILHIAVEAGKAILEVYQEDFEVSKKNDSSPLTEADRRAHDIILQGLGHLPVKLPVLSEEGEIPDSRTRREWESYWCVDPLDGTKEFVKRNGEFTVNIALMSRVSDAARQDWEPVFGVVYAPVLDEAYMGWLYGNHSEILPGQVYKIQHLLGNDGFWREGAKGIESLRAIEPINVPVQVVASRSHFNDETRKYIDKLAGSVGKIEIKNYGSSYKLCKIASGAAHLYPRFGPTMEWDTAAADAVCRAAGVWVISRESGEQLSYNKESLLNPHFLVTGIKAIKDLFCKSII